MSPLGDARVDYLRAALVLVVCVLAVSCSGPSGLPMSDRDRLPDGGWPTRGWRTAPQERCRNSIGADRPGR